MGYGSALAVSQNVTSNTYSAFTVTWTLAPIIGLLFITSFLYILMFKRDILSTLVVGYVFLGVSYFILWIFWVALMSWKPVVNLSWEICDALGQLILDNLWIFPSIPVAYYTGKFVQKWADKIGEVEK